DFWISGDFDHFNTRAVGNVAADGIRAHLGTGNCLDSRKVGIPSFVRFLIRENISLTISAKVVNGPTWIIDVGASSTLELDQIARNSRAYCQRSSQQTD
ncbi:hypothetical protein HYZ76_01865, partial [Candidatus Falkowbacteria bacterium]|nr:hypothetical protein [Candidatus Falkowbacteria bacterium]